MNVENRYALQTTHLNWLKVSFARVLKVSGNVPQHVAFIMDGNRRYARRNNIEVREGHMAGFVSMNKVLELCYECGVKTATVFAFSIENFKRSVYEVNSLMDLAKDRVLQITKHSDLAQKFGIRIHIIGARSMLPKDVQEEMEKAEKATEKNTRAILNICIPYTGRAEILHAIKGTIEDLNINKTIESTKDIDINVLDQHMYTANLPPLDLLIRTSGVSRLSDFLLWQASQKEVVIELADCLWPEFGPVRMAWILMKFAFRKTYATPNEGGDYDEGDKNKKER